MTEGASPALMERTVTLRFFPVANYKKKFKKILKVFFVFEEKLMKNLKCRLFL